jgi:hypothetical protein
MHQQGTNRASIRHSWEYCIVGKSRRSGASVLAIIAASSVIFAILGVGFYFIMLKFGGHREVVNATDAGSLQVGRDSLTRISVAMTPAERIRLQGLGDPRNGDQVDLLTFNRLVGMALIVQMNAQADGRQSGRDNANLLSALVQGPGSVGERLRDRLSDGNAFTTNFTQAYRGNSKRMTGREDGLYVPAKHQVAYVGQSGSEPSNLDVGFFQNPSTTPIIDFATGNAITLPSGHVVSSGGRNYLAGYKALDAGNNQFRRLVAASLTTVQPSLISQTVFDQRTSFLPGSTAVPPNAFRSASTLSDRHNVTNEAQSHSRAGLTLALLLEGNRRNQPQTATTFNPEIPRGYITIYNNGQVMDVNSGVLSANPNPGGQLNFSGNIFDSDHNVAAQQLGVGIDVDHDTGFFAIHTSRQVEAWKRHQVNHGGFPRPRSIIDPPHYLSLPFPVGRNNPVWENILLRDSHRDLCWRAYRGPGLPLTTRQGVNVDNIDPLLLEEIFGQVPAYAALRDPRHRRNPLMGLWRNPGSRNFDRDIAIQCGDGSIQPVAVTNSVTAHWIPYLNIGGPIETVRDTNISRSSALGQLMFGHHQFDNAYFGCNGWSYGRPGTSSNLTAAEAVKLAVISAYGDGPSPGEPACSAMNRAFASGLRVYPRDPATGVAVPYGTGAYANPWSVPGQQGVVSRTGTLRQIFEQVRPGSSAQLRRFVQSRMRQIRSDANDQVVDSLLDRPIEMSSRPYYIYLRGDNFVLTQDPPPAASGIPVPPNIDGRVFQVARSYPLLDTMANARNDNNIHEKLFMTVLTNSGRNGPPNTRATEVAQFATATGYNLELGKIALRQDANGDLSLCDRN